MNLGLENKVAIVSGASKGLGLATAEILLAEGAKVVISSRDANNLARAVESLGACERLAAIPADVTRQIDCEKLIKEATSTFGGLDILITNCGGPDPGAFESISMDQWDAAIDRSFKSSLYLIQAALPHLKASSSPAILTITSFTTKQPLPNMVLSNAIRSATIGLTKTLSLELGQYQIRVNSILPGWTMTTRIEYLLQDRAAANGTSPMEESAKIIKDIPLGRMGEPLEFGRAAAFLVSPAASFINGVMLNVDGGIHKGIY